MACTTVLELIARPFLRKAVRPFCWFMPKSSGLKCIKNNTWCIKLYTWCINFIVVKSYCIKKYAWCIIFNTSDDFDISYTPSHHAMPERSEASFNFITAWSIPKPSRNIFQDHKMIFWQNLFGVWTLFTIIWSVSLTPFT